MCSAVGIMKIRPIKVLTESQKRVPYAKAGHKSANLIVVLIAS